MRIDERRQKVVFICSPNTIEVNKEKSLPEINLATENSTKSVIHFKNLISEEPEENTVKSKEKKGKP